jgi:hypothetical protein
MDTHSRAAHEHRHRIDQKEERGGSVKVVREEAKEGQLTFTDLARANVLKVGRCAAARVPPHMVDAGAPLPGEH